MVSGGGVRPGPAGLPVSRPVPRRLGRLPGLPFGPAPGGDPGCPPRLRWDADRFGILDDRTARLLRRNLGTIIAEEPRSVRLLVDEADAVQAPEQPSGSPRSGRSITPSRTACSRATASCWTAAAWSIGASKGQALLVEEVAGRPRSPRWDGQGWPLSADLARRLYLLRLQAAEALREGPAQLPRTAAAGLRSRRSRCRRAGRVLPEAGVRQRDSRTWPPA